MRATLTHGLLLQILGFVVLDLRDTDGLLTLLGYAYLITGVLFTLRADE